MTPVQRYMRERWARRMATILELVALVGALVEPPAVADPWGCCFEGLDRLFKVDVFLASRVLSALAVITTDPAHKNAAALMQCSRFKRRLNHYPTAWRSPW